MDSSPADSKDQQNSDCTSPNSPKFFNIDVKELILAAEIVIKKDDMKVNLKHSLATGVITGVSTIIGGLILTPLGLTAVGATGGALIGSATSYALFRKKYLSLIEILKNLPENEYKKFINHLQDGVKDFKITDAITLITLLNSGDRQLMEGMKYVLMTYKSNFLEITK